MTRTQMQLTQVQLEQLRALAAEQGASISALIRRAVDNFLQDKLTPSREEQWNRAFNAIGQFSSAEPSTSAEHDAVIADAFYDWNECDER